MQHSFQSSTLLCYQPFPEVLRCSCGRAAKFLDSVSQRWPTFMPPACHPATLKEINLFIADRVNGDADLSGSK